MRYSFCPQSLSTIDSVSLSCGGREYLCRFYIIYIHSLLKLLMKKIPCKCEWGHTKFIILLRFQPTPTFLLFLYAVQWLSCYYIHVELLWLMTNRSCKTSFLCHPTCLLSQVNSDILTLGLIFRVLFYHREITCV